MRYLVLAALCAALVPASATASRYTAKSLTDTTKEQKLDAAIVVAQCVLEVKAQKIDKALSPSNQVARADDHYAQCFVVKARKSKSRLVEFVPVKI